MFICLASSNWMMEKGEGYRAGETLHLKFSRIIFLWISYIFCNPEWPLSVHQIPRSQKSRCCPTLRDVLLLFQAVSVSGKVPQCIHGLLYDVGRETMPFHNKQRLYRSFPNYDDYSRVNYRHLRFQDPFQLLSANTEWLPGNPDSQLILSR